MTSGLFESRLAELFDGKELGRVFTQKAFVHGAISAMTDDLDEVVLIDEASAVLRKEAGCINGLGRCDGWPAAALTFSSFVCASRVSL